MFKSRGNTRNRSVSLPGFTMVELLIVISLLGVLSGVMYSVINPQNVKEQSSDSAKVAGVMKIAEAAETFHKLEGRYAADRAELEGSVYLTNWPEDPLNEGVNFSYTYTASPEEIVISVENAGGNYVVYSSVAGQVLACPSAEFTEACTDLKGGQYAYVDPGSTPPEAPPEEPEEPEDPGCTLQLGDACTDPDDCCSDTCSGVCCNNNGSDCSTDTDCCGPLVCDVTGNYCRPQIQLCNRALGERCNIFNRCCEGSCDNGVCCQESLGSSCNNNDSECCGADRGCDEGTCCVLYNGLCESNSDCCGDLVCVDVPIGLQGGGKRCQEPCIHLGNSCNPLSDDKCCSGSCTGNVCCMAETEKCTLDADCCGDLICTDDSCSQPEPEEPCLDLGSKCSIDDTCCAPGDCVNDTCCVSGGVSCTSSADCCGALVCNSLNVCVKGNSECIPTGEPCRSVFDNCCDGTCNTFLGQCVSNSPPKF